MTRILLAGAIAAALTLGTINAACAGEVFVIRHKVADYATWRPVFDKHKSMQVAAGLTNPRVYHTLDDANDLTIVFDMADAAKAKAFASSKDLKARMEKAGVVGQPVFSYLETAPNSTASASMAHQQEIMGTQQHNMNATQHGVAGTCAANCSH
jgi:hypothetical protein